MDRIKSNSSSSINSVKYTNNNNNNTNQTFKKNSLDIYNHNYSSKKSIDESNFLYSNYYNGDKELYNEKIRNNKTYQNEDNLCTKSYDKSQIFKQTFTISELIESLESNFNI